MSTIPSGFSADLQLSASMTNYRESIDTEMAEHIPTREVRVSVFLFLVTLVRTREGSPIERPWITRKMSNSAVTCNQCPLYEEVTGFVPSQNETLLRV